MVELVLLVICIRDKETRDKIRDKELWKGNPKHQKVNPHGSTGGYRPRG